MKSCRICDEKCECIPLNFHTRKSQPIESEEGNLGSSNVLYCSLWSAVDMSDVSSSICLGQDKFTKAEMIIHFLKCVIFKTINILKQVLLIFLAKEFN